MLHGVVIWRITNPYRPFTGHWWRQVRDFPVDLYKDLKDAYLRARYGWAPADTFDLCSYHCGITLGLLKHFSENHSGHPDGMTPEEYQDKLDSAVMGWAAMWELVNDTQYNLPQDRYDAWRERMYKVYEVGMKDFNEIYLSLWN